MPWNRKTTRKHRHARNRHRTKREQLAAMRRWEDGWPRALRSWATKARDVIFRPHPLLQYLLQHAEPRDAIRGVDTPPPAVP